MSAVAAFAAHRPDFCILDVSMPKMDGFEVCRRIRARNAFVPVLFLTARNEEIDRVLGLELGADDYMGKPFGAQELVARVKAILRRTGSTPSAPDQPFTMGDLEIDPEALRARRQGVVLQLTTREVAVLKTLYDRAGRVVSRDQLYDSCWGHGHFPNSRALDQFVSVLRRKVEIDPSHPRIVVTVHGAGYRFDP